MIKKSNKNRLCFPFGIEAVIMFMAFFYFRQFLNIGVLSLFLKKITKKSKLS